MKGRDVRRRHHRTMVLQETQFGCGVSPRYIYSHLRSEELSQKLQPSAIDS